MAGQLKPLLQLGDRPLVARVVEAIQSAGDIEPIIVVTGHQADRIAEALSGTNVKFVLNREYERGEMLSSVQAGVRQLPPDLHGFLLALGDQPGTSSLTIQLLIQAFTETPDAIVIPTFRGRRGHPIFFPARCIGEILALRAGQTLKSVTHRLGQRVVQIPVEDPEVCMDIDTPEDYQELLARWAQRPTGQNATEAGHGPSLGSRQIGR